MGTRYYILSVCLLFMFASCHGFVNQIKYKRRSQVIRKNYYKHNNDTMYLKNYYNCFNAKSDLFHSIVQPCKVNKIKEIDNAYLIEVQNSLLNERYLIISLKSKEKQGTKIKKGKVYGFILFAYYPFIIVGDNYSFQTYHIDGVNVTFQPYFHKGAEMTTPNLKGLYYVAGYDR